MKLPKLQHALISPRKLFDYVLSASHPVGRFKAKFFARLGFSVENWERLDAELRRLIAEEAAEISEKTSFGQKYLVRGKITGPKGLAMAVVTVWIVLEGEKAPRFVTVYPEE